MFLDTFQADAEKGLVSADANGETATYGSADTGATDKPPPFDSVTEGMERLDFCSALIQILIGENIKVDALLARESMF